MSSSPRIRVLRPPAPAIAITAGVMALLPAGLAGSADAADYDRPPMRYAPPPPGTVPPPYAPPPVYSPAVPVVVVPVPPPYPYYRLGPFGPNAVGLYGY